MKEMLKRFAHEEDGQGMVEYGLIIGGIAVVAMAAIWLLGPTISNFFTDIDTQLTTTP